MIITSIQQQSAQSLILVVPPATMIAQRAGSAEAAYFAGLLDTGAELTAQTDETLSPMPHLAAAPTVAAYLIGLLDMGDE